MFYWTHTWIGNQWTVDVKPTGEVAREYSLSQNYPNPFNPSTQIKYSIAKAGHVALKVYDLLGREVTTLVNTNQEAGTYVVSFDFGKLGLQTLASGVYFYRLEAGSFTAVHKMMLMK
jgi:endo-1,4-beta-xylanase